jgi:murein DD-endopeptidase MepM/ murein hydrolase activator NlpD
MIRILRLASLLAAPLLGGALAHASETVTYSYDAKGRLVKVEHSGTVNNGVQTTYSHDKADNRKNTTTTGSPNQTPPP